MKKFRYTGKKIAALVLAGVMGFSITASATTESEIKKQQQATQKQLDQINSQMKSIEGQRNSILSQVNSLNSELTNLILNIQRWKAILRPRPKKWIRPRLITRQPAERGRAVRSHEASDSVHIRRGRYGLSVPVPAGGEFLGFPEPGGFRPGDSDQGSGNVPGVSGD